MNVDEAMEIARRYNNDERVTWDEFIPAFEQLAAEAERLRAERESWRRVCEKETEAKRQARAELAAAKAASVCPVKFEGVYANSADEAVVWFEEKGKAEQFADWLRDRMKEQNPAS